MRLEIPVDISYPSNVELGPQTIKGSKAESDSDTLEVGDDGESTISAVDDSGQDSGLEEIDDTGDTSAEDTSMDEGEISGEGDTGEGDTGLSSLLATLKQLIQLLVEILGQGDEGSADSEAGDGDTEIGAPDSASASASSDSATDAEGDFGAGDGEMVTETPEADV